MTSAVKFCAEGGGLREAAAKFNVPVSTLHRRVHGLVEVVCRPGPPPVLSAMVEKRLVSYLVHMSDMGFGLSRQDVMVLAFQIADRSGIQHPFKDGAAGRKWFDNFLSRQPTLTLRSPQSLSYARAKATNPKILEDFFAKLGSIYARLNLLTKPMQVYNVDETGINITQHKGKVVATYGRRNVHRVVAADKGKNHTVVTCGSASGHVIPPMIIFPRVRIPSKFHANAPPGSLLAAQKKGWVNAVLYLQWFKFFINNIPPARPILLIQDGHSSHISIELIELAKENKIHLLCLPAHTTHVLQPLDVSVFSSFKCNIGKALNSLIRTSPGRVPTTEDVPEVIAQAWPQSLTPINLMSGFRKTGIHPLNPGCIHDRECAPSKGIAPEVELEVSDSANSSENSIENSMETHVGSVSSGSQSALSQAMDDLFISPKLKRKKTRKSKPSVNATAVCLTENSFLDKYKDKESCKGKTSDLEPPKPSTKRGRGGKGKTSDLETPKPSTKRGKGGKGKTKGQSRPKPSNPPKRKGKTKGCDLQPATDSESESTNGSESSSDCECPVCGEHYGDRSATWIQCSVCGQWYDTECADLEDEEELPETYLCVCCAV